MSRFRLYAPKRPEGRFKYVPGLAGFEAMVDAVVCHQVAGARLAPARATPTWPGSRLDHRTICCGAVEGIGSRNMTMSMRAQMTARPTFVQVTVSSPGSDAIKERASAPGACWKLHASGLTESQVGRWRSR